MDTYAVIQAGTEAKYYADGSQVYCKVNYVVHTGTRTHVASVAIQAGTEAKYHSDRVIIRAVSVGNSTIATKKNNNTIIGW